MKPKDFIAKINKYSQHKDVPLAYLHATSDHVVIRFAIPIEDIEMFPSQISAENFVVQALEDLFYETVQEH